jgi:thymidylate synthase (FAD)
MKVSVVGATEPFYETIGERMNLDRHPNSLAEFAGRNCYLSFGKPNPATRNPDDYLSHIISSGHLSVLEHISLSLYVEGVSRSLLTELERHRHLSFSVVSQRYVDPRKTGYVIPPIFEDGGFEEFYEAIWQTQLDIYEDLVSLAQKQGCNGKQSREAARSVLMNMAETRFVVTGNLRTWREIIAKRIDPAADKEIQRFAQSVLDIGIERYGVMFRDLEKSNDS